jgi:hypothetical protein
MAGGRKEIEYYKKSNTKNKVETRTHSKKQGGSEKP